MITETVCRQCGERGHLLCWRSRQTQTDRLIASLREQLECYTLETARLRSEAAHWEQECERAKAVLAAAYVATRIPEWSAATVCRALQRVRDLLDEEGAAK